MKKIITLLILFIGFSAFSQERELNQLESLLEKQNPKTELFYNKSDRMLDLNGYQIPLMVAQYRYVDKGGAVLKITLRRGVQGLFSIFDGNKNQDIEELEILFANKADVYEAINLMDDIKRY